MVNAFVFDTGERFYDRGFSVERVLDGSLIAGISGDAAELNGGGELRPGCIGIELR